MGISNSGNGNIGRIAEELLDAKDPLYAPMLGQENGKGRTPFKLGSKVLSSEEAQKQGLSVLQGPINSAVKSVMDVPLISESPLQVEPFPSLRNRKNPK